MTASYLNLEHQWQAAIGNYFLAECKAVNLTLALNEFEKQIGNDIEFFQIYKDGKIRYNYDRKLNRITPVKRFLV